MAMFHYSAAPRDVRFKWRAVEIFGVIVYDELAAIDQLESRPPPLVGFPRACQRPLGARFIVGPIVCGAFGTG